MAGVDAPGRWRDLDQPCCRVWTRELFELDLLTLQAYRGRFVAGMIEHLSS